MYDPLKAKAKIAFYAGMTFLFGLGLASSLGWTESTHAMPVTSAMAQLPDVEVQPALDLSESFINVSEEVTPAVVRIEVQRNRRVASRTGIPGDLRRFFDRPEGGDPRNQQPQLSGGSGFIISADGYIMTNDHVVGHADQITVFLNDRRQFPATLVGTDPTTDVAVIKIEERDLHSLSFGDSDEVRVGEWILAVGNPGFGGGSSLDYTVTAGIISAMGRPLQLLNQGLRQDPNFDPEDAGFAIENFIQTDAVINPGNSGGPMVNLHGQVVGINSAIASQTGYYQGYGFAIPINLAQRVMEDLVEYGVVRRPWLGVEMQSATPEDQEIYNLPSVAGAVIQNVRPRSPAAEAGLRQEDVIVSVEGEDVGLSGELQQKIAEKRPGDRVTIGIYRDGRLKELTIRLGEAPINREPERAPERVARTEEKLGIRVQDLTPEVARELEFENAKGPIITEVQPSGPAARRGVSRYWKILEIGRRSIENADDVKEALDAVRPGEVVRLMLQHPNGNTRVVNVRVPN